MRFNPAEKGLATRVPSLLQHIHRCQDRRITHEPHANGHTHMPPRSDNANTHINTFTMPAWCVLGGRLPKDVVAGEAHLVILEFGPPIRTQNGVQTLHVNL